MRRAGGVEEEMGKDLEENVLVQRQQRRGSGRGSGLGNGRHSGGQDQVMARGGFAGDGRRGELSVRTRDKVLSSTGPDRTGFRLPPAAGSILFVCDASFPVDRGRGRIFRFVKVVSKSSNREGGAFSLRSSLSPRER